MLTTDLLDRRIGLEDLDQIALQIAGANVLRKLDPTTLHVEQERLIREAARLTQMLAGLDLDQLHDDALPRFGELLVSIQGLTMKPVGPVAHAFRTDRKSISIIMGPYGSAKTTTAFQKILNSVLWQPKCPDGVRRAVWVVIRDTYGHLEKNVMADWFLWFPKTEQNFNQRKLEHEITLALPLAGGVVEHLWLKMIFAPLGDQNAEEFAKGFSVTGAWGNELDTLDKSMFIYIFPRCGRYRPPGRAIDAWSGFIGDMNAPDIDNWTYDFAVNKNIGLTKEQIAQFQRQYGEDFGIRFHRQPGGLAPNAENKANLPRGYYERLQIGMTDQEVRRFVHNEFGAVRNGNPVYSGYRDDRHCREGLRPDPSLPMFIMLDGGSTPAALFMQKAESGQIRVLAECVIFETDEKKGLKKLGAYEFGVTVGEYWNDNFAKLKLGGGAGDPSAWYGGSEEHEEDADWIKRFTKGFNDTAIGVKLKVKPAPVKGNRIGPRVEVVREILKSDLDGEPKYIISAEHCPVLRQGYNSGYVTVRVQFSTGGGRWKDEPLKNDFSHVHDANQYGVLFLTKFDGWEDEEARAEARRSRHGRRRRDNVRFGGGFFAHREMS